MSDSAKEVAERHEDEVMEALHDTVAAAPDEAEVLGPFEAHDELFQWGVGFEKEGLKEVQTRIKLAEEWAYEGEGNGLNFSVGGDIGGRVLFHYAPQNYTDGVWVSPENVRELTSRLNQTINALVRNYGTLFQPIR